MSIANNTDLLTGCKCFTAPPNKTTLHKEFESVRNACHAINKVFIPDNIWPEFQQKTQNNLDATSHQSMFMIAYESGHLHKLTSPVHRYLLDCNGDFNPKVNNNYKEDLKEKWILREGPLKRHQKSKGYRGKLAELQCAEWLEEQGWELSNLEALGGDSDIEAISPDGESYAIEVKFVGLEDEISKYTYELEGQTGANNPSPDKAHDFLLVKAYEAANQFSNIENKKKIALIVIDKMAWIFFKQIVKDGWLDIKELKFRIEEPSQEWLDLLGKNDLSALSALDAIPSHLDELWIAKESDGYEKEIVREYYFP